MYIALSIIENVWFDEKMCVCFQLGGVSDEDLVVPTRTREFFANLSTKQDVMAMVKGRIALMKENPLNKTPGMSLWKHLPGIKPNSEVNIDGD